MNFYPRSPCGERLFPTQQRCRAWGRISIHALLAESDPPIIAAVSQIFVFLSTLSLRRATLCPVCQWRRSLNFYPRSPCGERRGRERPNKARYIFLSTLSLRRATGASRASSQSRRHFYPRSPCGERPWCISRSTPVQAAFLSTLSLRRATMLGLWDREDT